MPIRGADRTERIQARIPEDLMMALRSEAAQQSRSINSWVLYILKTRKSRQCVLCRETLKKRDRINYSMLTGGDEPETPVHPGALLELRIAREDITQEDFCDNTGIRPSSLRKIIRGLEPVTADIAVRIGMFFKENPRPWMEYQIDYDLMKSSSEILSN